MSSSLMPANGATEAEPAVNLEISAVAPKSPFVHALEDAAFVEDISRKTAAEIYDWLSAPKLGRKLFVANKVVS